MIRWTLSLLLFVQSIVAIESLPDTLRYCHTPDGDFITRSNDQHIGFVLSQGRLWEKDLIEKCAEHIREHSTVVDIGANIGTHSVIWSKKAKEVVAFEPQRLIFQQLCANLVINGCQNVRAYPLALGHQNGRAQLDATVPAVSGFSPKRKLDYQSTSRTLNFGGIRLGNDGETVEMRTLDSFELTDVSLIKVDVEGAEPLVFYGAMETIKRNKPVIVYEKRSDYGVTEQMKESLQIPEHIASFDIEAFVQSELPGVYHPPMTFDRCGDHFLIPKNTPSSE